jgi:hypothetical protein
MATNLDLDPDLVERADADFEPIAEHEPLELWVP